MADGGYDERRRYRDDYDDRGRRGKDDYDDRGRDRDRRYRDDDRSRDGGRGGRDDRDVDRRHRRSSSRGRSRDRSRSPSRTRDRKKQSGFDLAPPGTPMVPQGQLGQLAQQVPFSGVPQPMPGMFAGVPMPGMFPNMALPNLGAQAVMAGQATRHARRVYVGGLPPMANEQTVAMFFNQAMNLVSGNTAAPGDCVVNVYLNGEKKFAFVEFRSVEEASNAMALDGLNYEGVSLRIRRPSDYNPAMAAALGPSTPSPNLNLGAVGLTPGSAGGADGPDRVFVGGLPYYLTEEQIKELLGSFGALRAFDLVKDRETGGSKGYGFCVYQDSAVTDVACAALNGMKIGDKTLTVRRATASGQPKPDQTQMLVQAQQQIALQKLALLTGSNNIPLGGLAGLGLPGMGGLGGPAEVPTRVVELGQAVSPNELQDDQDYEDIKEDMREECTKYGQLVNIVIPRPDPTRTVPGLGKVFLEYADTTGSMKAKMSLNGRKFGGNVVSAAFYPEEKFNMADYS